MISTGFILSLLMMNAEAKPLILGEADAQQLAELEEVSDEQASAVVALISERGGLDSVEELRVLPELSEAALNSLRKGTVVQFDVPEQSMQTYSSPTEVLAEFDSEPSIQQVQDWASDYARLSPSNVDRWLAASKSFAALPQLTVEYRVKDDWGQDFDYVNADGVEPLPNEDTTALLTDADQGQDATYYVRARWDLDQLVMSSERIRVINEAQDIAKLRDKVLSEITRLYFERRRVQVEMLLSPKRDTMGQVKQQLRLMEITASIDALTGGAYSQALKRQVRRAAVQPAPTPEPKPAPTEEVDL